MDTCTFICYHILSESSVSLPPVCASLRILAVDKETFPTFITISATLNVIYYNSVSNFKITDIFTNRNYLSAWFMSCDHVIISCAACFVRMFIINIFQITSTKAGSFHFQKHLSRSRFWNLHFHSFNLSASRKFHSEHFLW